MKKEFLTLKVYEWIYLVFWCVIISIFSFLNNSSIYALISSLFGIIAVTLNIKNSKYAFIFYILYAFSYGVIAFVNHNYGEGILNVFYNTPLYLMTFYNLFISKKNKKSSLKINSLSYKGWIIIACVIPLVTLGYGFILSKFNESNLPYINALATGFALVSSFLASKRYKEQWYLWMVYSLILVYIWMYSAGERVYLFLNIFYVVSNAIGLYIWLKQYKEQVVFIENK